MREDLINKLISLDRYEEYASFLEYEDNLLLCKQAYIPLSVLEVTLRNSLDKFFTNTYGENWYIDKFLQTNAQNKINNVQKLLKDKTNKGKIIAELPFGFWTNLFHEVYRENLRFNNLKKIFPNLPSLKEKKIDRKVIYDELNIIRNFRNRAYHNEKVVGKDEYKYIIESIYRVLSYFDKEVLDFVKRIN